jgi:4-hydroxybenzoate polyprenyltransferase
MPDSPIIKRQTILDKLIACIFYGNYFYGLCVLTLILETCSLLNIPCDEILMYTVAYIATVLFYSYPYTKKYFPLSSNPRTQWYFRNRVWVNRSMIALTLVFVLLASWSVIENITVIKKISGMQWLLLLVFPATGALYYGTNFISGFNLRQVSLIKPFVIGFVWAGAVSIYPVLYYDVKYSKEVLFDLLACLLFLKNFMFVSVLAIMFDIKDYVTDSHTQLNTLVVKIGLRKTIFYVLLPLPVLGLLTFLSYAIPHQFDIPKMILILLPFLLLIAVAYSLKQRRSLLYYLIVVDGLMVLKALFGIVASFV